MKKSRHQAPAKKVSDLPTPLDVELFRAVEHNWPEDIAKAIAAGANVNGRNASLSTPLHVAANRGYTRAFMALLNAGADVNAKNAQWRTPLHMAASVSGAAGIESLHYASALLALGADANPKDKDNATPAKWASYAAEPVKGIIEFNYLVEYLRDIAVNPSHRPTVADFNLDYPNHPIDLAAREAALAKMKPKSTEKPTEKKLALMKHAGRIHPLKRDKGRGGGSTP